jgi:hypothetical protein
MTATLATVAGILKEVYEGDVRDQITGSEVTIKRITKSSDGIFDTPGGKYVVFPVRKNRNQGISYRDENTQLAPARRQGYAQAQETLKYGYGRVKVTGQMMELAETNPQAFMSAFDGEIEGIKDDVSRDSNRIAVGNRTAFAAHGFTGVLARSTAISSGSTITVDSTQNIEVDMLIDFVDNTGATVSGGSSLVVTSVTNDTTFVVGASVAGVIVGTNIIRNGNWNKEPYGLTNLVSATGTVHGINSATAGNEYWRSTVDSTTTTLTEAPMISMCDTIRRKSGQHITAIFMSLGVRRSYFNLMTSLRRYNEVKEWTGGLVGLAFNYEKEVPVVTDIDMQAGNALFLNENEITVYRNKPWYWANADGNMLKWVSDYDAYEALLKQYWQIVNHRRNAHGIMTNVVEAS